MDLKEILQDVLPTKWSRWIMVLTFLSLPGVSFLPHHWPFSILATTDTERQIFRVLLLVLTLLIGSWICLILVVIDRHRQIKKLNDKIHNLENPSQTFVKVDVDALNKIKII